ncbi:MAG: homoserine kinase [Actinomycetota bacterium]
MKKNTACLKACATSANLGPGFDRAGLALALYNHYRARFRSKGYSFFETNSQKHIEPRSSLVVASVENTLKICRKDWRKGLAIEVEQNIPPGKGLGSSAADIIAGILIADKLYGLKLSEQDVFEIALGMEKHPDNIAAAITGGLAVCYRVGKKFSYTRLSIHPHIRVLLFIPKGSISTRDARKAIPDKVPAEDAADNIANFCLLADSLRKGDISRASVFIRDRLYQEYRRNIYPASMEVLDKLNLEYGIPAAISGSGPSVIAFVKKDFNPSSLAGKFPGFSITQAEISFNGSC